MNTKKALTTVYFLALLVFASCGGSGGGGGDDGPGPTPDPDPPAAATLVFPEKDKECTEGTVISDTQSEVTFRWNESANTDNYTLKIKNLLNGSTSTYNTSATEYAATILRGTPYSWSVESKANGVSQTAESETWKFYNAGEGIENYAPYPAEVQSPAMGENITVSGGEVTLSWTGSDLDGDLINYDVYFDTVTPPVNLEATAVTEASLTVSVSSDTVYYWQVVSRDAEGNTSQSEIFEFKVN